MKFTYNAEGPRRKELANAVGTLLDIKPFYKGPRSFAYEIGSYIVDKDGNLLTPEEATKDDLFLLTDALFAEYGFKPEEELTTLFSDEEEEADEDGTDEGNADDGENEEEAEDSDEEPEAEATEEPEPETPEAPEAAPVAATALDPEDDTEGQAEAPENGDSAPDKGEEAAEDVSVEDAPEATDSTEEPVEDDEADDAESANDDTKLTLSLPREKFSDAALQRLRSLIMSKQTLLKKVFETDDLRIPATDTEITFPWFTLHGIDGEVDAYAKFVHAIAMRALTSSRISSTERQTDNDKFTMRLFLNNLGFKGEEYKFARRFLVRNLEGNGAWRYGNAPNASSVELDMPTVFTPKPVQPETTEPDEAGTEDASEEENVGNEEESSDEE